MLLPRNIYTNAVCINMSYSISNAHTEGSMVPRGGGENREKKENLTLLMKPKVGRMPGQKGARSWDSSEVRRWR